VAATPSATPATAGGQPDMAQEVSILKVAFLTSARWQRRGEGGFFSSLNQRINEGVFFLVRNSETLR